MVLSIITEQMDHYNTGYLHRDVYTYVPSAQDVQPVFCDISFSDTDDSGLFDKAVIKIVQTESVKEAECSQ